MSVQQTWSRPGAGTGGWPGGAGGDRGGQEGTGGHRHAGARCGGHPAAAVPLTGARVSLQALLSVLLLLSPSCFVFFFPPISLSAVAGNFVLEVL